MEQNQSMQFVPQATIVNYESCSLRGFYNFLVRQYLTVRLNNPWWRVLFFSNSLLGLTAATTNLFLFLGGAFWWEMTLGYLLLIGALTTEILVGYLLVRRQKRFAGIAAPKMSLKHWVFFPVALVILNYVNLIATFHAATTTTHLWRGINYRFPGKHRCEIIQLQQLGLPSNTETVPIQPRKQKSLAT